LLQALNDAVAHQNTTALASLKVETKSGNVGNTSQGKKVEIVSEIGISENGEPFSNSDTHALGAKFEIDPVMGPDGYTLDVIWALNYNPAAPEEATERFTDPMTGHDITWPLPRFHQVSMTSSITMTDGTTRLLSIWKPTGPEFEGKDLLQCAILTARVIRAE
jgi:hypothetical protein